MYFIGKLFFITPKIIINKNKKDTINILSVKTEINDKTYINAEKSINKFLFSESFKHKLFSICF